MICMWPVTKLQTPNIEQYLNRDTNICTQNTRAHTEGNMRTWGIWMSYSDHHSFLIIPFQNWRIEISIVFIGKLTACSIFQTEYSLLYRMDTMLSCWMNIKRCQFLDKWKWLQQKMQCPLYRCFYSDESHSQKWGQQHSSWSTIRITSISVFCHSNQIEMKF